MVPAINLYTRENPRVSSLIESCPVQISEHWRDPSIPGPWSLPPVPCPLFPAPCPLPHVSYGMAHPRRVRGRSERRQIGLPHVWVSRLSTVGYHCDETIRYRDKTSPRVTRHPTPVTRRSFPILCSAHPFMRWRPTARLYLLGSISTRSQRSRSDGFDAISFKPSLTRSFAKVLKTVPNNFPSPESVAPGRSVVPGRKRLSIRAPGPSRGRFRLCPKQGFLLNSPSATQSGACVGVGVLVSSPSPSPSPLPSCLCLRL